MKYRVEIYDEYKPNDLTFYSDEISHNSFRKMVKDNIKNFNGDIRAYVFDNKKKKKIMAMYLPMEAR
jgi:hypothetical protein